MPSPHLQHPSDLAPISSGEPLITRLARWSAERPDAPAYGFTDFSRDTTGTSHTLTWAQVARRVSALTARLSGSVASGDRVAILCPQGLDYVVSMLATLHTPAVAVPLFAPGLPGHGDRLRWTLRDCAPAAILTTSEVADQVEALFHDDNGPQAAGAEIIAVDEVVEAADAPGLPEPGHDPASTAYLQYTSGSTRQPTGVVLTHGNLSANVRQLWVAAVKDETETTTITTVGWLPLFHDMGLILTVAVPLLTGSRAEFMDPATFVMRPVRWLELLSRHEKVFSAAPNFGYEHCVKRVREADRAGLDLSGVRGLLNGAEPIRPETMRRFIETFEDRGLSPSALAPAYGLAEATVYVSMDTADRSPRTRVVDRDALAAGIVLELPEEGARTSTLVSCGSPVGQRVAIVDPEHRVELAEGSVGEIWVRGPNVAASYWGAPERGANVFGATLGGTERNGSWLRTGDLGALIEGELYVTGRAKDLVIADGRNHYPQDIEATVAAAHPHIRDGRVAAFAVPGDEGERLVVMAETRSGGSGAEAEPPDPELLTRTVRQAVSREHGLHLHELALVGGGEVRRTSSGKIARRACREDYLKDTGGAV
ncbi:fatty acid CoA ligase FadD32 [Lipingzhangella halophila]|uniref:Fatty acid CoA ligase FadD32 n=1 Tax=Lipingzhangella halophila TaxID=1783352 RepID=A0A7W7RKX9_9ACTN|nr:fatty acyl-AMP ligase [Lipingzhangella halophila]MBB4933697.1 fatty acid CoA ligase FadD32 [Lipingzhangella halophila]